ncbi:MAG TPA: hypothetical protein GYA07_08120 [Verrucomicrobia bacterium]|nr:hypothetical protein [Verrucomicrobiota bacterium]
MPRLTHQDLLGVIQALGELYAHTDLATLPKALVGIQSRLVPCDISTYNEIDTGTGELRAVHDYPHDDAEKMFPRFMAHVGEHPIHPNRAETARGRVVKTSDFMTQRQFERLGLFNEFYRYFGIRFQMAFYADCGEAFWTGTGLQRIHRDFSERDRQVLGLLSPHVGQAYRNAKSISDIRDRLAVLSRSMSENNCGIVQIGSDGRIRWMTGRCGEWLRSYFGMNRSTRTQLPDRIHRWLAELKADNSERIVLRGHRPLVVEQADRTLTIHLSTASEEETVLLLREDRETRDVHLKSYGLTAREREVAVWIARGKTNPEVGQILGISPRTVDKHEERILHKLAVENRAGIMLRLLSHPVA